MSVWSHQSIAVKLPIGFALVLLVLGAAIGIVSYLEMRRTVISIASLRLEQAAAQMATVLGTSSGQRVAAIQQLMRRADVIAYLRTRDARHAGEVEDAIRQHLGTATAIANVEVWDPSGTRLLAAGAPFDAAAGASHAAYLHELQSGDAIVGRLRLEGDAVIYPVGGRIVDAGTSLGFLVERRRISNPSQSQQTVALLSGLIGSAATIVVGNGDGSAWTNLSTAVAGVPVTGDAANRLLEYDRPGMPRVFAWAKRIESTPWIVAIEFPRDEVMAPADRLARRAAVMAAALLLLAVAIGWAYSTRITTPLRRVTEAAEAAAELRHVAPIKVNRDDEIGRLADAFNVMTERVEEARRDLERRVEDRTAELTAVNRELESFSYSVSHDLRAPLRAIVGFVQILEEDHAASMNAEARRSLERVKANATRMGQLIDDLLTLARIGRTPLTRQRVDLNQLARTIADESIAAADHPVELVIDPLPPCVGEPVLLQQVLANLISNAVKFTARTEGATIRIGATTNGETTYFVRDNGAGFDERFADKLFGVFQRLHRTVEFEGTGVGLAIVQRIINRHGGRVWAEGKVNEGATFYFTVAARH
jgi:signal transduction histidine kinase